jgi:hypothetical protein
MKKLIILTAVFSLALFSLVLAQQGEKAKPAEKSITITGQVVDYECAVKSGGAMLGGDHQGCAEACIKEKGLPIGLLTKDKKMYLVVSGKMMSADFREKLGGLVNKQVKATGKVHTYAGSSAIALESVEAVAPGTK